MTCGKTTHKANSVLSAVGGNKITPQVLPHMNTAGEGRQAIVDYYQELVPKMDAAFSRNHTQWYGSKVETFWQDENQNYRLYHDLTIKDDSLLESAFTGREMRKLSNSPEMTGWAVGRNKEKLYVVTHHGEEDAEMTDFIRSKAFNYRDVRGAKNFLDRELVAREKTRLNGIGAQKMNEAINKLMSPDTILNEEERGLLSSLANANSTHLAELKAITQRLLEYRNLVSLAQERTETCKMDFSQALSDIKCFASKGELYHCPKCGSFVSPISMVCNNERCSSAPEPVDGYNSLVVPPKLNRAEVDEATRTALFIANKKYPREEFEKDLEKKQDSALYDDAKPEDMRRAAVYQKAQELSNQMSENAVDDIPVIEWDGVKKEINPIAGTKQRAFNYGGEYDYVGFQVGDLSITTGVEENPLNQWFTVESSDGAFSEEVKVRSELAKEFAEKAERLTNWGKVSAMTEFERGKLKSDVLELAQDYTGESPESLAKLIRPMKTAGRIITKQAFDGNVASPSSKFVTDGYMVLNKKAMNDSSTANDMARMKNPNARDKYVPDSSVEKYFDWSKDYSAKVEELGHLADNNGNPTAYLIGKDNPSRRVLVNPIRYNFMKKFLEPDEIVVRNNHDETDSSSGELVAFRKNGKVVGVLMSLNKSKASEIDLGVAQRTLARL